MKRFVLLICLIPLAISLPIKIEETDTTGIRNEESVDFPELARSDGLSLVPARYFFYSNC